MEGLGHKLKEAREELGLSFREVEEATKIRTKYLQALENEDFEVMPGKTYARGFIKNYAKFLGLDPDEFLEAFDNSGSKTFQETEFTVPQDVPEATPELKENRLFKFGLIIAAILILFISSTLWSNFQNKNNAAPEDKPNNIVTPAPEEEQPKDTPKKEETPNEEEPPEVIEGVKLEVEIINDSCWVKVVSDGENVFSGMLNEGDKRVFEGDSQIVLTLGSAGNAKVTYNGEEQPPLGAVGEVVTPPPFVAKQPRT